MLKWIERKDLIYWFLFLLFTWLITRHYETTLSQWSFAGTIISIILAVIAIIYSFDQSSTNLYSTRKLEESANKIEKVTQLLESTSNKDIFNKLEQRIESLNSTFDENMKSNLSKHQKELASLLGEKLSSKSNSKDKTEFLPTDSWEQIIDQIVRSGSVSVITLFYTYLCFKHNKELDYQRLAKYIFDDNDISNEAVETIGLYLRGSVYVYTSMNAFILDNDNTSRVSGVSDSFKEAIEPYLADTNYIPFLSDVKRFLKVD